MLSIVLHTRREIQFLFLDLKNWQSGEGDKKGGGVGKLRVCCEGYEAVTSCFVMVVKPLSGEAVFA